MNLKILRETLGSKTFKSAFFLFACFLGTEALAAVFEVGPLDRSKLYLGMVFGGNVGGIPLSGDSNTTLSLMFKRFNVVILTVGVLVLAYIGVISTINTAREGEALGKKLSLWVPLRAMLGTLLMVPSPASGYSVVQITVVWIVLNGIGAANSIWSVMLDQLNRGAAVVSNTSAGITKGSSFQGSADNLETLVNGVMQASTCLYALNNLPELKNAPGIFQQFGPVKLFTRIQPETLQENSSTTPSTYTLSQEATLFVGLEGASSPYDAICGKFTIKAQDNTLSSTDSNSGNTFNRSTIQQITQVKLAALQAMFNAVDPATRLIAQSQTTNTGAIEERFYKPPVPGYCLAAQQAYSSVISQIYAGVQTDPNPTIADDWEQGLNSIKVQDPVKHLQEVLSYGWIHAGSYYYSLVKSNNPRANKIALNLPNTAMAPIPTGLDAKHLPSANGGNWPTLDSSTNAALTGAHGLLTNFAAEPYLYTERLNNYLTEINGYYLEDINNTELSTQGQLMGGKASTGNKFLDKMVNGIIGKIQTSVLKRFQSLAEGHNKDPLKSLQEFGWSLMLSGEIITLYGIGLSFAIALAVSSGSCMSPFPWANEILMSQITPLLFGACAMLWTGGATLGIYLPMVPYLIFTTAAFSWILAVIEAVVGAPIVALALAHPSGEELGKVGQPLILLANVFLRPMLMLFGFVLGAGLLRAGIALINFGFIPAVEQSTTPTLFSILAVLMMYIMLIMAIVNKSFSLIYLLPNQIMRWLGGPTETSDPSDMVKEAKGGFDSGAKAGQGALNEGVSQGKSAISEAQKKQREGAAGAGQEAKHQQLLGAMKGGASTAAGAGGMPGGAPGGVPGGTGAAGTPPAPKPEPKPKPADPVINRQ